LTPASLGQNLGPPELEGFGRVAGLAQIRNL
jgi:hypothetical protein